MLDVSEIVYAHGDVVWRIAVRLLRNEEDARDCYQQTFLEAVRLGDRPIADWRAMLCSIATRRAIDQMRRRYRNRKIHSDAPFESFHVAPPDRDLIYEELRQRVRDVLAASPDQQAEAFWLRHIEQLSTSEVAAHLGVNPGHVRVLVHRATKYLRVALAPMYGHEIPQGESNDHE